MAFDTVSRIQDYIGGTTRGVKGNDNLNSGVESGSIKGLESNLRHLHLLALELREASVDIPRARQNSLLKVWW